MKARQAAVRHQSAGILAALRLSPTASTGRGPKYLFSCLLTCGQCQLKFIIMDPRAIRSVSISINVSSCQQRDAVGGAPLLAHIRKAIFQ